MNIERFTIGHKGDAYGFRIFAGNLFQAIRSSRLTVRPYDPADAEYYHDGLFFRDRFALPVDHIKRLLKTCQDDTVLTFRFADDLKTVSIEIQEGNGRPTVVTFKNQIGTNFRNWFFLDIDPALFPTQDEPETTPQPDPVVLPVETAVATPEPAQVEPQPAIAAVPVPAQPKPRKRRQPAKKRPVQPSPQPDWLDRFLNWLDRLASRIDGQPLTS